MLYIYIYNYVDFTWVVDAFNKQYHPTTTPTLHLTFSPSRVHPAAATRSSAAGPA